MSSFSQTKMNITVLTKCMNICFTYPSNFQRAASFFCVIDANVHIHYTFHHLVVFFNINPSLCCNFCWRSTLEPQTFCSFLIFQPLMHLYQINSMDDRSLIQYLIIVNSINDSIFQLHPYS